MRATGRTRESLQRFLARFQEELGKSSKSLRRYPPNVVTAVIRELLTNPHWCPADLRRDRLGLVLAGLVFDHDGFWRVLEELADVVEGVTARDARFRDLLLAAGEISRGLEEFSDTELERLIRMCRTPAPGTVHESRLPL